MAKSKSTRKKTSKSNLLNAFEIDERLRKGEAKIVGVQVTQGNKYAENLLSAYVDWQRNNRDKQSSLYLSLTYRNYKKYMKSFQGVK